MNNMYDTPDLSQSLHPMPKVYKAKKEPAPINKIGKKVKQWIIDRAKLIKEAIIEGTIELRDNLPYGFCPDCRHYHYLDPDHRLKRSQGGSNDKSNIDWICRKCHDDRDNKGDPLNKKERNRV